MSPVRCEVYNKKGEEIGSTWMRVYRSCDISEPQRTGGNAYKATLLSDSQAGASVLFYQKFVRNPQAMRLDIPSGEARQVTLPAYNVVFQHTTETFSEKLAKQGEKVRSLFNKTKKGKDK
jgi:hypothetical protein